MNDRPEPLAAPPEADAAASYVYLASQSPRRSELLDRIHIRHRPLLPDDDEDAEALELPRYGEMARAYVRRVARLKASAALSRRRLRGLDPAPILTADTTVALGRLLLGKPADAGDAARMLALLSGRTHRVMTAVVVTDGARSEEMLSESRVRFRHLSARDIATYVASGEPLGKAGAYAIQGRAAAFVERIAGSYSGIVGLPLFETVRLLDHFGIRPG